MSDRAIRSVAVVGGGIVGLSAALAFRSALPQAAIAVVDIPADPAALADRLPTSWPSVTEFHSLIGLDELDLLRSRIAVHHIGTVFENWPDGRNWVHGFGPHGKPVGAIHFDQIWAQAMKAGQVRPYESYSAAEVLARAGKFVHPTREPGVLRGTFRYGLRLDPELYRARLLDRATGSGVELIHGEFEHPELGREETISALILKDGTRLEADLFVDCSGPAGLLIGKLAEDFEGWQAKRRLVIEDVAAEACSPVARVTGIPSGCSAEWPLPHRTIRCVVGNEGAAGIAIRPGRRPCAWAANVLALGDAAVAVDPISGLNLALVHRAIFLALELLPSRDFNPLEVAEFNRRWLLITDQVRDISALLHLRDEAADLPETLVRRLDQYGHRGRLPFQEDAVLNRDDWTSALLGMGVFPRNIDPTTAGLPLDRVSEAMNKIADDLAEFAAKAPAYPDYLAQIRR